MIFHNFVKDEEGWHTIADETLFENPHISVHRPMVTSPTRPEPFRWLVAHRKGAVVIAPMNQEGDFILVRQERVPIRATIWEFPAGQIDDASEFEAIRASVATPEESVPVPTMLEPLKNVTASPLVLLAWVLYGLRLAVRTICCV